MRVLNWSPVKDLRMVRAEILGDAGCEANSPESPLEAMLAIHAEQYQVLLLCDQEDPRRADELCRYFRAANPEGRIVALDSMGRNLACENASVTVDAHNPRALVDAVCPLKKGIGGERQQSVRTPRQGRIPKIPLRVRRRP
jgi:hypothetical protein